MKKTFLLIICVFTLIHKPAFAADNLKCAIDYEFFEKSSENRKTIKLSKDRGNYKLVMKENEGQQNAKTTSSYIYSDQNMVYTVIEIGGVKSGSKHALETMFVGMMWGIYFLNFPKADDFTSIATRNGSETILSRDCMIYDAMMGNGGTKYYFWNDIMLKKVLNDGTSPTNVVTIQAININESPVFDAGEFTLPSDVQYF